MLQSCERRFFVLIIIRPHFRTARNCLHRTDPMHKTAKGNTRSGRYQIYEWSPMISIRGSLSELDRAHQIREAALDCYVGAIKNSAHYALDLDAELTGNHRQYLRRL